MAAIKLDVAIRPSGKPHHDLEQIKRAEQLGFDTVWLPETARNPFLLLTLAAKETKKIRLGVLGAFAFPRSPMIMAQLAWDLARQAGDRFALGLGMPAPADLEGRFGEDWAKPAERMREYLESLRAIWDTFQTDARLRYRGKHYQFRLMAPFFNPGPISQPAIPIYLAGDGPSRFQLAGELCQGLHLPALRTPLYLRELVMPALEKGLRNGERKRKEIAVTMPVCVISAEADSKRSSAVNALRERLARQASAPALGRVMSLHGWGTLADELCALVREQRWADLQYAISDDVLREFAIIGAPGDVYAQILERYSDSADSVCLEWEAENPALFKAIAGSRH